jgi:hypothetical protein
MTLTIPLQAGKLPDLGRRSWLRLPSVQRSKETPTLVVRASLQTLYGAIDKGVLAVRLPKHLPSMPWLAPSATDAWV